MSALALPLSAVATLVRIEYDTIAAGVSLDTLADELEAAGRHVRECAVAARKVRRLRVLLGQALEAIDPAITAAVEQREEVDSVPF